MKKKVYRYIYDEELNDYEKDNRCLSYKNLFYNDENLLLCNNIAEDYDELELYSACDYDEENEEYADIYQYYLIDESTANRLAKIGEIIYYHNKLDLYILGVTHCGTSWGYVLTDIKLEKREDVEGGYIAYYMSDEE